MSQTDTTQPVKGAGTTLWIYQGHNDPFANPLSDIDWVRLAKVKDLTPGELTAEAYDDTYLDDDNADWKSTAQGEKSAGETSYTLAWRPGETGQQDLVRWFEEGTVLAYRIKYPNGAADLFRGWVSSLGKSVPAKEVITRTVKITNNGKPVLAEATLPAGTSVTGVTATPANASFAVGETSHIAVTIAPADAADKTFGVALSKEGIVSVGVTESGIDLKGLAVGQCDVVVFTGDGHKAAIIPVTIS